MKLPLLDSPYLKTNKTLRIPYLKINKTNIIHIWMHVGTYIDILPYDYLMLFVINKCTYINEIYLCYVSKKLKLVL